MYKFASSTQRSSYRYGNIILANYKSNAYLYSKKGNGLNFNRCFSRAKKTEMRENRAKNNEKMPEDCEEY